MDSGPGVLAGRQVPAVPPNGAQPHKLARGGLPRRAPIARRTLAVGAGAFGIYLLVSVGIWWHVWTAHPSTSSICGCGDPSLFIWFIQWPAHAIAHGLNPLYSTAMLYPKGVNLLDNTSVLAVGVPLAPVTWLWGPVATVNVASTLAPAVSALAMFWALRRWVRWTPAAFVGGLFYGFAPFVLLEMSGSYLMLTILVVPPLVLACLDDLVIRQRRSPVLVGIALALLAVVQFFLSTEVLLMMLVAIALGMALVVAWSALHARHQLYQHLPHAAKGAAVAVSVGGVLLAYPLWFALAGPGHLSGPIWLVRSLGYGGNSVQTFWHLSYTPAAQWADLRRLMGGYQGSPMLDPAYLGWGLLAVVGAGWALWWRDARLWFLGVLGVLTAWFSVGTSLSHWTLWTPLANLPELQNVIPARFSIFVNLCAAGMLALIMDHTVQAINQRRAPDLWLAVRAPASPDATPAGAVAATHPRIPSGEQATGTHTNGHRRRTHRRAKARWASWRPVLGAVAGLAVAATALAPIGAAEAADIPLTAVPVTSPRWFTSAAPHLPSGQVLFIYPFASSGVQSPMVWQAQAGMPFSMVGGGGPGGTILRAGKERPGATVLSSLSIAFGPEPAMSATNFAKVRAAFRGWGVTMAVIPDQSRLRSAARGRDPHYARRFLAATLGRPPQRQRGAWVWTGVQRLVR